MENTNTPNNYSDLVPIVTELKNIVDGLQYIINKNNIQYTQPFLKSNPHGVSLPRGSRAPGRNKDKYLPRNPDKPRKEKKPRKTDKPSKTPKPPKIKNFTCYHEGCTENFPVWKLARMHMVEKHDVSKPKYKRAKDFPSPHDNTKTNITETSQ